MNKHYSLCFLVQAGRKHGTGHLRRCLSIAALHREALFIIDSDLKNTAPLEELIPYPYHIVKPSERDRIKAFVEQGKFDALVIDCAAPFPQAKTLCSLGIPSFVLDQDTLGDLSDLFIQALPFSNAKKGNFCGPAYTPIRQEFFDLPEEGDGILITLGGSDPYKNAPKAAAALKDCGRPVTLVSGSLSNYGKIEPYENLTLLEEVPDLAPLFTRHSLIICGPGMTLLEALAARKKVIVISHTSVQYKALKEAPYPVIRGGFFFNSSILHRAMEKAQFESLIPNQNFSFAQWWGNLTACLAGRAGCCPVCGSCEKKALSRSEESSIFQCRNCGSPYVHNLAPSEELSLKDIMSLQNEAEISYFSKEDTRRCISTLKNLRQKIQASGGLRLLDIGARDGDFVQAALDNGIQGWGLELSGFLRGRSTDLFNIEIFESMERAEAAAPYTIVSFWNGLEYASSPVNFLRQFAGLLCSGGILAFRVPAADTGSLPLGHFQITEKGGQMLALRAGLKPLYWVKVRGPHQKSFWEIYSARP